MYARAHNVYNEIQRVASVKCQTDCAVEMLETGFQGE